MNNPYVKYAIAILIVLALAEVAPQIVNSILILVLIGMMLANTKAIASLAAVLGSLGK